MNFIQTDGGLHIVLHGKPVTLHKSDKHYDVVLQAIKDKKTEQEVLDILETERRRMEEAVVVVPGITLKGGQLYHNGDVIDGVLGNRMLQMLNEGFDLAPMAALLANLQRNPSFRVVQNLYPFLEKGKNPITDDGCFLAFKAVREDFRDIRSGNFDNSVGQVLSMTRNKVDEDPNRTCSYGFHVCSFDYLPHFANANGHVMVCKVNPADVVAIPADYSDTKMRVCKYEVIGEYEGYYTKPENVLGNTTVNNGVVATGTFKVEVRHYEGDSYVVDDAFDRLSDAASCMEDLLDDDSVYSVRIVNTETGTTVAERENSGYDNSGADLTGDQDDTFSVHHIDANGDENMVGDDFGTVAEAASFALEQDGSGRYEVRDDSGRVEKTIS